MLSDLARREGNTDGRTSSMGKRRRSSLRRLCLAGGRGDRWFNGTINRKERYGNVKQSSSGGVGEKKELWDPVRFSGGVRSHPEETHHSDRVVKLP